MVPSRLISDAVGRLMQGQAALIPIGGATTRFWSLMILETRRRKLALARLNAVGAGGRGSWLGCLITRTVRLMWTAQTFSS